MDDLQTFLASYERAHPEDVWRIRQRVPRDYVVTATALEVEKRARPPVLIFENVEGTSLPTVTGLFSSYERISRAIGATPEGLHDRWSSATQHLIPPQMVARGGAQDVVLTGEEVDVSRLPLMVHFAQDAGRYITSGVIVARDPDTGTGNLSFARLQLKGPRRFGVSLHSRGHLWDYQRRAEARGDPLQVAVVVGAHPAVLIGAASKAAMEVDEYDIAGALLGHPLAVVAARTVDLPVPAEAEIVIEGMIEPGVREPEGPFGEYTGYTTGRSTEHVLTVTALTRRLNPYFLDVCPGASRDHIFLSQVQREAEVLRRLRETLPNVRGLHYPVSGTHFHCYLAIDSLRPGDARHAALLLLGLDPYVKLVIVVDSDIDITSEADVMWAVATRAQPAQDVMLVDNVTCNALDPSSHDGLSSKMAIDATRPAGRGFERCTVPEAAREQAVRLANSPYGDSGPCPSTAPLDAR